MLFAHPIVGCSGKKWIVLREEPPPREIALVFRAFWNKQERTTEIYTSKSLSVTRKVTGKLNVGDEVMVFLNFSPYSVTCKSQNYTSWFGATSRSVGWGECAQSINEVAASDYSGPVSMSLVSIVRRLAAVARALTKMVLLIYFPR